MADLQLDTVLSAPTHFLAATTVPGKATPNVAQTLLWSATRRIDVAAYNDLTLSSSESVEGTAVHTEINAAITAMNAAGGGIVYLRPGVYWISDSIRMKSRVHLMGSGYSCTVIRLKNNSNKHCVINDTGTAELYSIGRLRVSGNRDGQGVPMATQNVWVNGLHLIWSTSGFTYVDPQCYFYDLWVQDCACDCYHLDGRGGHVGYNLHGGDCRRWGAMLSVWDSIFYGIYVGGIGGDGIRLNQGPVFLIGCKSFFCGTRTAALSNASLRLVDGSSPITPSAEDWRYGAGYRLVAAGHILSSCESQDTGGHGIVIDGTCAHTVSNHRFGNIGSIGRHFSATYPNAAAISDIAAVFFNGTAHGSHISGVLNDQFTNDSGELPQCDWTANINQSSVRENTVDVRASPLYLRQTGGRFTKTPNAATFLGNDLRIGHELWDAKIADFTAVAADHRKTWWVETPLTTITAVAATVGANWQVRIINRTGITITAGGQSITANQDGVLSSNGSAITWTNGAALTGNRVKELLASATLTVEDHGRIILAKVALTITGTAANLGDGFRCTVSADGGAVTWGSVTIASGNIAKVAVVNGKVVIASSTPSIA